MKEVLPASLNSTSLAPSFFDGTTRFYLAYVCPHSQRIWITRNYKGLQEKIKLVAIDLQDRPSWYKEIYPKNKTPALEHNKEVKGDSLDVIKYIDTHFEGPALLPADDPEKQAFADHLLAYSNYFTSTVFSSVLSRIEEISPGAVAALNKLEDSLSKFEDGPFFLGHEFSLVDIAYAPFVERYQIFLSDMKRYDITKGRPKLTQWIEELNKIEAYTATKRDPQELLNHTKKKFGLA